jgi:hypothetical protein
MEYFRGCLPSPGRTGGSLVLLVALSAAAEDQAVPDKSIYHLFNPVPRQYLRPLTADRPDKTDTPHTVDAGHFQLEMDFASFAWDHRPEREAVTSWEVAPVNLKAGLLNNVDFQLGFSPWHWEKTSGGGSGKSATFGEIIPRVKWNLFGNDEGSYALALMPFLSIPTEPSSDEGVEGGLKIPFELEVPGWDVGFQAGMDVNRDEGGRDAHFEFSHSVTVGHSLAGKLNGYAEFYSNVSTERHAGWVATFDTWLTYQVTSDWRLDAGVYIGLTPAAEDWHPFVGMTWRY